ncbi:3'-5' exonuclease [Flagellimonas taeanensis]|uniref:3'-5' exonuclease n=1 Tax=Flavobacteriaceae TaxID=49546 RepID=UPI000E69A362|nr:MULTISPECIES: 3'-5' exonuclease [Allomuricauda]MDC6385694.1 3'-5' exonuclease [Muricauda sp. SK9]RIV51014.1 3'-5' exonuclease [Allomuricauda taeanensis]
MWPFSPKKQLELPSFWREYEDVFQQKLPEKVHDNTFIVWDTETTGFRLDRDRMLCIGAVKLLNGSIAVKDSFEVYIHQEHYDAESAGIHGILRNGKRERISELDALKLFLHYIKNHVLVGHHVMFDVNMVNAALRRNGLPKLKNKTLDTGLLYKRTLLTSNVLHKKEKYALDELAEKFSISKKDRHTALGDALITAIAFLRIVEKLTPRNLKDLIKKQDPPRFSL